MTYEAFIGELKRVGLDFEETQAQPPAGEDGEYWARLRLRLSICWEDGLFDLYGTDPREIEAGHWEDAIIQLGSWSTADGLAEVVRAIESLSPKLVPMTSARFHYELEEAGIDLAFVDDVPGRFLALVGSGELVTYEADQFVLDYNEPGFKPPRSTQFESAEAVANAIKVNGRPKFLGLHQQ